MWTVDVVGSCYDNRKLKTKRNRALWMNKINYTRYSNVDEKSSSMSYQNSQQNHWIQNIFFWAKYFAAENVANMLILLNQWFRCLFCLLWGNTSDIQMHSPKVMMIILSETINPFWSDLCHLETFPVGQDHELGSSFSRCVRVCWSHFGRFCVVLNTKK